jgi:hypothetical protein
MASNVVTLPIAKSGGVCLDVQSGLTGAQITPPPGQSLRTGLVALIASNTPGKNGARQLSNSTDAAFEKYSGLAPATHSVAPGGCIAYPLVASPIPTITGMDPGTISLTGPGGLAVTMQSTLGIKGAFFSSLSDTAIPSTGGTFTFKGSGGADVGSFTTTITLANPLLQWTNAAQAATIDKTRDFLVTWTGGNPNSYVVITGSALDSARTIQAGFTCLAPVEDGRFTIPSYILATLPSGIGGMLLQNDVYSPLSASGLDSAIALGSVGYSMTATYGAGAK